MKLIVSISGGCLLIELYYHRQKWQILARNVSYQARSTQMRVVQNCYTMVCPPVLVKIHSLKLVDLLLAQAGKRWYNYYFQS